MSTDYFIFLKADGPAEQVFAPLCEIEGVDCQGDLSIRGLHSVICEPLSPSHQKVMLEQYGAYGLNVNWHIRETYDKESSTSELVETLYRCAAIFVNAHPERPLSLMRDGEDFYVFNSEDRLILSRHIKAAPDLSSLFQKPFTIEDISF